MLQNKRNPIFSEGSGVIDQVAAYDMSSKLDGEAMKVRIFVSCCGKTSDE